MKHTYLLCIPEWDADEWTELESGNMYDAASSYVAMSEGEDPDTKPESLDRPIEVHVKVSGSEDMRILYIGSSLLHIYDVYDVDGMEAEEGDSGNHEGPPEKEPPRGEVKDRPDAKRISEESKRSDKESG